MSTTSCELVPDQTGDDAPPAAAASGVLGWCIAVCGAFAVGAWRHRWLHEDGLINLRVVDQLLLGNGPVFNSGERVEAFTSPAQVMVVALARVITLGAVPVESVVFVVGVASAVGGLWCAIVGAARLWGPQPGGGPRWLPIGAVVFAAVPMSWDFATSGHEGGLAYLWLGASLLVLAGRADQPSPTVDRPRLALVLLGSGALVRPEYALYSAAFVVCWLALHREAAGSRWRSVGWACSLVVVGQVLRMGYFGAVVPNTALAKLGGGIDVDAGTSYVFDFVRPFGLQLAIPAALLLVVPVLRQADRPQRWVVASFAVPTVLVLGQLVVIGGDYINGRLLVAPLFALAAPVALVPRRLVLAGEGRIRTVRWGAVIGLAAWAVVSAAALRAPWQYEGQDILNPRYDAREMAIRRWTRGQPLTEVRDYRSTFLAGPYHSFLLAHDRADGSLLWVDDPWTTRAVPLPADQPSAIASGAIGALGVTADPDLRIIDRTALADPVASRQPVVQRTAGHLRYLPTPWVYARAGVTVDPASAAAERAMGCGELGEVVDSATAPMGWRRFLENVVRSPANTMVRVPADPGEAVDDFC